VNGGEVEFHEDLRPSSICPLSKPQTKELKWRNREFPYASVCSFSCVRACREF